ncbi:MAG: precorrin-3B C(17)-methyltransferase [Desulfosalsimonadaceae bacterium]
MGIGPGAPEHRTFAAVDAICRSRVVAGYSAYMETIRDLMDDRETIVTGMRQEKERVRQALMEAAAGKTVALVSSGDPGVYGMAGLALEMADAEFPDVEVEIVPGVTAATAAAAAIGAPLMLDFAVISLSDLLVPWERIQERLDGVAKAGLVTVLYNPRSRRRVTQLDEAVDIFLRYQTPQTPAAVVTYAGCENETVWLGELGNLLNCDVGMHSIVMITNEFAKIINRRLVMPRGYRL